MSEFLFSGALISVNTVITYMVVTSTVQTPKYPRSCPLVARGSIGVAPGHVQELVYIMVQSQSGCPQLPPRSELLTKQQRGDPRMISHVLICNRILFHDKSGMFFYPAMWPLVLNCRVET